MAAVPITIVGIETRSDGMSENVTIVGMASITGLGIGGGPIIPDDKPPRPPTGIWPGPGDPDFPGGGKPPRPPTGIWPGPGDPDYPIKPLPPNVPNVPPPGSPPVIVGGTQPTHPMVPPPAIVVDYPGIGKVVVPQPTQTTSGPVHGA